jgi:hypothetical protein
MKQLETITEHHMVAAFLKAEVDSPRWKAGIQGACNSMGITRTIIDEPDLNDINENDCRAKLLSPRGYPQKQAIFGGFPNDVQWIKVLLNPTDFQMIRVLNAQPWIDFTGGSRIAWDAAQNFKTDKIDNEVHRDICCVQKLLRDGESFPEIILVGKSLKDNLVILEGHVRSMAYLMNDNDKEVVTILGLSEAIASWHFY